MRLSACSARCVSSNDAGSFSRKLIDWNTSPRNTGMNCSFSPQIYVSNAGPAAGPARPGLGERRAEAVGKREHTDEYRNDQADAERGERGGDGPLYHAADVVGDGDHSTFRRAWTIGRRAARSAGTRPLASIR